MRINENLNYNFMEKNIVNVFKIKPGISLSSFSLNLAYQFIDDEFFMKRAVENLNQIIAHKKFEP